VPDGEDLEPRFDSFSLCISKRIHKRRGSTLYLTKDTFNCIPISVTFCLKLEPKTVECLTEKRRTVNEKLGLFDGVFPLQFAEKQQRPLSCSCLKQPHEEKFVRFWVDGGVQPFLPTVDPDHRLVDRDLIRDCSDFRL